MSKLEELIQQYCPNGVEYVRIGDIAQVGTGSSNGNEAEEEGEYPFFVRSQTIKKKNDFEFDEEAIIIPGEGGIGDIFHYINGKYALHQRVYRIHFTTDEVNVKFVYHYMRAHFKQFIMMKAVSATVVSIRKPMIEDFSIPVPPLPVQEEIVRLLDCFDSYRIELNDELEIRKGQYEYVKQQLFGGSKHYSKVTLGSSCAIEKGRSPIQKTEPGEYPMVVTTSARKSSSSYQFDQPSVCIPLVSSRGHGVASLNSVYYQEGKFALGNILCAVTPNNPKQVCAKYLYYYLNYMKDLLLVPLMKGGANVSLRIDNLVDVQVPIPPIDEQHRMVIILDKFETFIIELLPAEIEARQKQYEYYRDKLLTFKRKEA